MYQMMRSLPTRSTAAHETATFAVALATAELLYKFHSFTLEAIAFLATWYALSWAVSAIVRR